jgi:hypothetical protein
VTRTSNSKLTADTITDDQISELRDLDDSNDIMITFNNREMSIAYLAERALTVKGLARRAARARCAEILNARAEGKS